ncbi:MAG: Ig-like domain-containing protein [Chlorobi bacterium]|nr:Ig-like domain-containing protein [Chlorobiota bacterium]
MRKSVKIVFYVLMIFIIYRCAHPVMPSGGKKDTMPPVVIETEPQNRSARFASKKFTITFDEFIQLENITQKVLISPPMKELPEFRVRGKSLQVKFMEDLKPNTTYSINFADAITDITEKNALLNYTYIFSTGDKVDSMSIAGDVYNAFDLKPVEDVSVMLYKVEKDTIPLDSMPFKRQPYYLSKTDKNGHFVLTGLADIPYMIFALKDLNANYIYDQPGEEIAFLDSLIRPQYIEPMKNDTAISDSSVFVPDTVLLENPQSLADSLRQDSLKQYESQQINYELFLFDEKDSAQKVLGTKLLRKNVVQFAFTWPAEDVTIKALNFSADTTWHLVEMSPGKDTVTWFIKNLPVDTLDLLIMHGTDTLDKFLQRLSPIEIRIRNRKKNQQKKKGYLEFKSNIKGNTLRLDKDPELIFDYPVVRVISDSILLVSGKDSTYNPEFYFDDSLHRKMVFPVKLKEETRYTLVIPDSAVIDWNGLHNKEKSMGFSTKSLRDYGIFVIEVVPAYPMNYILQLMTDKEKVKREVYFSSDTTFTFNYLAPGDIILKVIYDANGNRKWDSGNFIYKIEPEWVDFYDKKVTIRANWEVQEEWKLH